MAGETRRLPKTLFSCRWHATRSTTRHLPVSPCKCWTDYATSPDAPRAPSGWSSISAMAPVGSCTTGTRCWRTPFATWLSRSRTPIGLAAPWSCSLSWPLATPTCKRVTRCSTRCERRRFPGLAAPMSPSCTFLSTTNRRSSSISGYRANRPWRACASRLLCRWGAIRSMLSRGRSSPGNTTARRVSGSSCHQRATRPCSRLRPGRRRPSAPMAAGARLQATGASNGWAARARSFRSGSAWPRKTSMAPRRSARPGSSMPMAPTIRSAGCETCNSTPIFRNP